ncbi:uncharacterized protein LOC110739820 [Chenopodium quinoa]|uniref:uncharacterized protein LOC110739820 n=1 Tax=Chenopodium quinoa TaxID=63459 RepID=UPI000B786B12|nr:uncharacterized protein LOC110739820 [Chenopodium quinoa]
MDDDNVHTPEDSTEESDSEVENDGDVVNYSAHFVTDTVFLTFDDAFTWADAVAINLGFILVKSSFNKQRDGRLVRYLRCDRGRRSKPRDLENAIRKDTKTKGIGCPFYIKICYEFVTNTWFIRAKDDVTGTHNHPMIAYPEGHRKISGLSPNAKQVVRDMTKSKVAPRNIMATIAEQFPADHPNIRHIYNCRNDFREEMSDGRGVVQQFLHLARQSQYVYWVMSDDEGVLQHAFMVHPVMVDILRTYPYVIGMDSTYKTNRYGMPFFEIVSVTPTNQNFLVAYVFMRNESTASYRWVLQRLRDMIGYNKEPSVFLTDRELGLCAALREVFPGTSHLLCRWHINKDVEARVTAMFKSKKIGSLDTVWARVHSHIGNQIIAIRNGLEASRSKIGQKYRQLPLSRINGKVSQHCLKVLDEETRRMRELSYQVHERCGCAMRVTHGLPCACQIHDSLAAGTGLYIRQIHPFWRTLVIGSGEHGTVPDNDSTEDAAHFRSLMDEVFDSDPAVLRNVSRIIEEELHSDHSDLREPAANHQVRGRPRHNDTRRDRSYFEHVNRQHTVRGARQTGDVNDISQSRYRHMLPGPMLPYITGWKDVIGDGNCGFRCVAEFFFGDQGRWYDARETIANEVLGYRALYERIYGLGRLEINVQRIRWDGGAVDSRHWMVAIQDLFPIATWFNAAIIILGVGQTPTCYYPCLTILPLRARRGVTAPEREFVIATVGASHFICLELAPDSPLPPVAGWWTEHHDPSVDGWDQRYEARRNMWDALIR